MSLNAIVTACNQVSNRDPVVSFDEGEVERMLRALADRGLAKMVHRPGDRVVKYRQALDTALEASDKEIALIAVLLLRGIQTPGELRQRTTRYVEFTSLPEVETTLEALRHREVPLVSRLERRPGQKEHRYRHLLSSDADETDEPAEAAMADVEKPMEEATRGEDEDSLRSELDALRARVEHIERELGIG